MLVCSGCGALLGPSTEEILLGGERACQPVIESLETFHGMLGHYPETLDEMVREGLVQKVPELPSVRGAYSKYGPDYQANRSLDFFRLSFGYYVPEGIGPGDTHWRTYESDNQKGWVNSGQPGPIEDLVADRLLAAYRKNHDSKTLRQFMAEVIGKVDCEYLERDRIVQWLGDGAQIEIPANVIGPSKTGECYGDIGDASRYCIVYKNHWRSFPRIYCPIKGKEVLDRGEKDFVLVNFPVVDRVFSIDERADGEPSWVLIRECPPSPRDSPS
jgi:hypothetical protein